MTHRKSAYIKRSAAALIMALGLTIIHPAVSATEPADALSPAVALETFDQVWNQVRDQYFDYERLAPVWEQAQAELRPQAEQAETITELRALLAGLLERIGESHFAVLPAEFMNRLDALPDQENQHSPQFRPASTGLGVRLVDGRVRVTAVRRDGPAWLAGIRHGWEVVAVDDHDFNDMFTDLTIAEGADELRRAQLMLEISLQGLLTFPEAGRERILTLTDHQGQSHQVKLSGSVTDIELIQLGNLPPMALEWHLDRIQREDHCVMQLAFSSWVPALNEALRQRRDELLQCTGLVIDLRGNLGGVITTMVTLGADLFDHPTTLGSLMRADGQVDFRVLPRRVAMDGRRLEPFDGPIAILIDRLSASTSEMFAGGMQASGRARLFGETSAGMALPAQMLALASGDVLMYAFADYRDSSGRRIEGLGVVPDLTVPPLVSNPSSEIDEALAQALSWIERELSGSTPISTSDRPEIPDIPGPSAN